MSHQLLKIVNDLVHSRGLRAQFNRDPEAFMARYDLEPEWRTAIYTMDAEKIGEALGKELGFFKFEENEFPECTWGAPLQEAERRYPAPTPETFGVVPDRTAARDGLEVSVWGQSFPSDAVVVFDPPLTQLSQRRQGTYRCCEIVVTLQSPAADTYAVTVKSERLGTILGSKQTIRLTLT